MLENDVKLESNSKEIVIFGAGSAVGRVIDKLEQLGMKDKVACICDNRPEICEKIIRNIKVMGFERAYSLYRNADYIVYNRYATEISQQLIEKGIEKIHYIKIS